MSNSNLTVIYSDNNAETSRMNKADSRIIIFSQFLLTLFHYIDREHGGLGLKTKVYLYDKLGHLSLSPTTRDAFRNYLLRNRPLNIMGSIEEETMKKLVQFLYDKMCELFGPINADTYMANAMHETQRLPEAAYFHPRELL